jgi:alanyl-tRNA synthetase
LLDQTRSLEKEINRLKQEIASNAGNDLLSQVYEIKGIKVLSSHLSGVESKSLRPMVDDLKNQIGSVIVLLGVSENDKVSLIAGVTKDLTNKIKAGELVNFVALQVGGKGGGRPDMAQAGGTQPENLDSAIASVSAWIEAKL